MREDPLRGRAAERRLPPDRAKRWSSAATRSRRPTSPSRPASRTSATRRASPGSTPAWSRGDGRGSRRWPRRVDRMKTSAEPIPVIVVGGGSDADRATDRRAPREMVKPEHFEVANASAPPSRRSPARSTASYSLDDAVTRRGARRTPRRRRREKAIDAGADRGHACRSSTSRRCPLAYLPGNATRIRVKAVGDLALAHAPSPMGRGDSMREISSRDSRGHRPSAPPSSAPAAAAIPTSASCWRRAHCAGTAPVDAGRSRGARR